MTVAVSKLGEDLEPGVRRFVEQVTADYRRHGQGVSHTPAQARAVAERVRQPWRQGGPVMQHTEDLQIPTRHGKVRVRIHQPQDRRPGPALVYLHGGGWTIFSIDTHDRLMREYAARAGMTVVGVDYSLSPEAKFPVALEECADVVAWVMAEGGLFDIDPARVAVGGDSAGGNLAVAVAMMLRDKGAEPTLRGLLLNYASFGGDYSAEYHARYGGPGYMLSSEEVGRFITNYLRTPEDRHHPLIRVIDAELEGLPPTFMAIPECDLLACQSFEMEPRLRRAGVDVTAVVYKGASHSFLEAVSISEVANRAFDDEAAWLRRTV